MNDMIKTSLVPLRPLYSVLILSFLAGVSCTTAPKHSRPANTQDQTSLDANQKPSPSTPEAPDSQSNKLRIPRSSNPAVSTSTTIDRARVLPILKTRKWLYENQASSTQGNEATLLAHDYNDELVVIYALDDPNTLTFISTEAFERAGMTRRELRMLAIENLKSLLPRPVIRTSPLYSMIVAGKKYESSLLLLDDLWKGLAPAKDDLIVAIPARNVLLFTESSNQKGIVALRKQATLIKQQSAQGLTDILFIYQNGQFARFD